MAFTGSGVLGPISVGNVVSTAINLYKANFKSYFGISLRAHIWIISGLLALILVVFLTAIVGGGTQNVGLTVLIGVVLGLGWLAFYLFCSARFTAESAIVSRLAYSELSEVKEDVRVVRQEAYRKTMSFLGMAFLLFLLSLGVNIAINMASSIFTILAGVMMGSQNNFLIALGVVIYIVALLAGFLASLYFSIRWFLPDVALIVERNTLAADSIGRSWSLTNGSVWRIGLAMLLMYLISAPLMVLLLPLVTIVAVSLASLQASVNSDPTTFFTIIGAYSIVGILLFALIGIIILPLWQAMKGTIYHDLRARKEGIDISLRQRQNGF
jgi:hypothetical protein